MRTWHMVLDISQDDLDIITAVACDASASIRDLAIETSDGRIGLSVAYTRGSVVVRFRVVCGLSVWSEDTIAVSFEEAMLGSSLRLPARLASWLVLGLLRRYALEGGISAKGSSLLIRLSRLRLPLPLSLLRLDLKEIILMPGLIRIVSY